MAKEIQTQSLQPGSRLKSKDRVYEIVKVLGAGSFGITYQATADFTIGNIITKVNFAIKEHFVSKSCFRDTDGATVRTVPSAQKEVDESRADFITEANRLKRICQKSRNIVSVNETFEANGTAYYVMEFLDGGSLEKCSEEEAIAIVRQLAEALSEIHKEKVLHLDLKPDNVVLKTNEKKDSYPVLIDFGISKHFDSKGSPTSSLGAKGASPGYAPQEQYAEITKFSPKYDIYALGAVLYFLITGKNPPSAFDISPNQQELKKELGDKVSKNVRNTILHAMAPSAWERTSSADDFLNDLKGVGFSSEDKTDDEKDDSQSDVDEKKSDDKEKEKSDKGDKEDTGTVIFKKDSWWVRNRKKAFFGGGGLLLFIAAIITAILAIEYFDTHSSYTEDPWIVEDTLANNVAVPYPETEVVESPVIETPVPKSPSDDELFANAKTIKELKVLADKGYVKAFAPLAEKYLINEDYSEADKYARKALKANSNRQKAIDVIKKLNTLHFYDNGENGGVPIY